MKQHVIRIDDTIKILTKEKIGSKSSEIMINIDRVYSVLWENASTKALCRL